MARVQRCSEATLAAKAAATCCRDTFAELGQSLVPATLGVSLSDTGSVQTSGPTTSHAFDFGAFPHAIVMDMGGRNLHEAIENEALSSQDLRQIQQVTSDILAAIAAMHKTGQRHGDIKSKNIVRHDQRFKLIDFDLSAELGTPLSMIDDSKLLGSSAYLPPELILHATHQHRLCGSAPNASLHEASWDLWGLGCTVYEMVSGGEPMFAKGMSVGGQKILK